MFIKKDHNDAEVLEEREELFSEMIQKGALSLEENRRIDSGNIRYSIQEILLVWFCGMICGFKKYEDIEYYAASKITFFRRFFEYKYGTPSKSTIARMVGTINPKELDQLLKATILNFPSKDTPAEEILEPIALDGKSNCGMQMTAENRRKVHMVSAYDTATGMTIAQQIVGDKSNEIVAIKSILPLLDINGRTITIDAMGTQKEIAKIIRAGNGNYVLAVKQNNKKLHQEIKGFFKDPNNQSFINVYEEKSSGHGRIETRTCCSSDKIQAINTEGWVNLASIVMVKAERTIKGVTTICCRYFITNLVPNSINLSKSIRCHWGIESMHWLIDVTFGEDGRIVWSKTVAENESIARRIVLNVLKIFRETFRRKSTVTTKSAYSLIQMVMLMEDDRLEMVLRSTFK